MNIIIVKTDTVEISMKLDEVGFLHAAMNEICNGYHIPMSEFVTRLGYERSAGDDIMNTLADAYNMLNINKKSRNATSE
jgi:hypothetical protein